jgi:hypothetical protein
MPARRVPWLVAAAALALPGSALAHLDIDYPPMWNSPFDQKASPCGTTSRDGAPLTVLRPGSELTVKITETIFHPGHFRVMLDTDPEGVDFPVPVDCDDVREPDGMRYLADNVLPSAERAGPCADFHSPSQREAVSGRAYDIVVTLPDVECDNCTLQVVQIMTDSSKHPSGTWNPAGGAGMYYRCAAVRLSRTEDPTPDPDPGDPGDPGDPNDPNDPATPSGGCTAAGAGTGGPLAAAVLAALLFALARRRPALRT